MGLREDLERLRPQMAAAAQKVINEWQQDDEGFDEVYGPGGPCDEVAGALLDVIHGALDVEADFGASEGDDHEWVVVSDGREAFLIDIPPGVYETGGGYSWKKVEGAEIGPGDIVIEPLDAELARGLLSEGHDMERTLLALAGALEKLGERNSAQFVRVVAEADPPVPTELLDPFKSTQPEKLRWLFPAPSALRDLRTFISVALDKYPEFKKDKRRGEILAARKYITHLLKDVGPSMARQIQRMWAKAYDEYGEDEMWRLKQWWVALGKVWTMLQVLLRQVNAYERQPEFSTGNIWERTAQGE